MLSPPAASTGLVPQRRVEAELLDELPADDPRAIGSRRDLRWINAIMMQPRIVARTLARHCRKPPRAILDLGAGDGTVMLKVAHHLSPHWSDVRVVLLDRQDIVSGETRDQFKALRWEAEPVAADVFAFLDRQTPAGVDAVVANLFLHHFEGARLTRLLAQASHQAPLFVACEPRRSRIAVMLSAMTWAIGANDVTRHDAAASVRAGFSGKEISAHWPDPGRWRLHEWAASPLSHCFVAARSDAGGPP